MRRRSMVVTNTILLTTCISLGGSMESAAAEEIVSPFTTNRTILDSRITESSGLAPSTYPRRVMWTHNDSGDTARVFGVGALGGTRATLTLSGAENRDFEDMAAGPNNTLWVGDLGDDAWNRPTVQVYKFKEPEVLANARVATQRYDLRFEDGPRNAEALLVHPVSGRVFVVTKSNENAGIYRAPLTLSTTGVNLLTRVADAPANITAGSFDRTGSTMVLCDYQSIRVYDGLETVVAKLPKPALALGESLALSRDGASVLVGSEGAKSPVYAVPMPGTATPKPTPTPTPTPTPAPSPVVLPLGGLGVYNGSASESPDETTLKQFGAYPEVASSYYHSSQTINIAHETARIRRGTSPNITVTTKGTQYLAGIAKGDPKALAWLDTYVASLKRLAAVDPQVPVYATLDHEFRGKVMRGEVTGESASPVVYGKALSVLFQKVRAVANIKSTYWFVGYDRKFEGAVGNAFATLPAAILFDPYANSSTDTIETIASADIQWIKSQGWYVGQPIALAEFGMPVKYGDAAMAKFFTNVRGRFESLGIAWGVFFNRSRDLNTKVTTGSYPMTVKAITESLS